jgi:hypothetical protein
VQRRLGEAVQRDSTRSVGVRLSNLTGIWLKKYRECSSLWVAALALNGSAFDPAGLADFSAGTSDAEQNLTYLQAI